MPWATRTYTLATTWFTLVTTWRRKWACCSSSRKETITGQARTVSKSVCLKFKVNSFEQLSIIEAWNSVLIFDFVSENNPRATSSSVCLCPILERGGCIKRVTETNLLFFFFLLRFHFLFFLPLKTKELGNVNHTFKQIKLIATTVDKKNNNSNNNNEIFTFHVPV